MATLNLRLDDEMDRRLAREAEIENRTRSELARAALAAFLEQRERERFQDQILRAAGNLDVSDALALAAEALATDNEAQSIAEAAVREPAARYRAKPKKR